jgi:GTPase SAR1 family protein
MVVMLVANKCDMESKRAVPAEEGMRFARENDLLFIETSAKTAQNVDEAFTNTARTIYQNIQEGKYDLTNDANGIRTGPNSIISSTTSLTPAPENRGEKSGCCN